MKLDYVYLKCIAGNVCVCVCEGEVTDGERQRQEEERACIGAWQAGLLQ